MCDCALVVVVSSSTWHEYLHVRSIRTKYLISVSPFPFCSRPSARLHVCTSYICMYVLCSPPLTLDALVDQALLTKLCAERGRSDRRSETEGVNDGIEALR